jgi:hypothetical protein
VRKASRPACVRFVRVAGLQRPSIRQSTSGTQNLNLLPIIRA